MRANLVIPVLLQSTSVMSFTHYTKLGNSEISKISPIS